MSSYHTSFSYLNQNSIDNFNLIISHFEADNGESETGLATESIYTASADGTKRNLYGTKYAGAEPVRITLIKPNGGEFSVYDNRRILRWLTGSQTDSWLDLKVGDEVQYRMFGHVQNVLQYKLDSRIIGLIVVFESASPWAFSDLQTQTEQIDGAKTISIINPSDDLYGYTNINVIYQNIEANGSFMLQNAEIDEVTSISGLGVNETVTLDANQMITSDNPARVFGNNFNFIFPRLISGTNTLTITGKGTITFNYYYCIKIGDMAINLNADTDPICNKEYDIEIDVLSWSRIINTPTTLQGYGITDAYPVSAVYNKNEIDEMFAGLDMPDIDISQLNTYTKIEIDEKLQNITSSGVDISEDALNAMIAEVLG